MLKSGNEHLEGLRDGRVVYVGKERVNDVTSHSAFRNGAASVASLFDLKQDSAFTDVLSYEEEGGQRHSAYYLLPRSRDDLVRRMKAHKLIADKTCGLFGRSPDHVSSFVAGMALQAEYLDTGSENTRSYADNLLSYYQYAKNNDLYIAYAVIPSPGARDPEFSGTRAGKDPELRVVREDSDGVVVHGMKLLATAAVFADEIWVGNVQPLAADRKKEAITFAIPVATPGITLWSRKPMEPAADSEFDYPLSSRFDETDSVVLFEDVKVPWERVFCHDDPEMSRLMYYGTPSHCFGNHQSNVRFWSKLEMIVGLAHLVAEVNQTAHIPAVKDRLGRLAALEAMLSGVIYGQCMNYEDLDNGYLSFNRRHMYGALTWCTENYAEIVDHVREMMGAGVFTMPADISVLEDDELKEKFEDYWRGPNRSAVERMKVFKLAWDMLGSEFASRHWQYERFYAGPPYVVRSHSYREAPWDEFRDRVNDVLNSYDVPDVEEKNRQSG